jgi:hypothetical protein
VGCHTLITLSRDRRPCARLRNLASTSGNAASFVTLFNRRVSRALPRSLFSYFIVCLVASTDGRFGRGMTVSQGFC